MLDVSKKAFIAELNSGGYKHSHANNKYGNRKRAYGDYLYHQDREKFEVDYAEWKAAKLRKATAKDSLPRFAVFIAALLAWYDARQDVERNQAANYDLTKYRPKPKVF